MSTFTVSNPRLSLNELTASLGSTKATAHRYTMALREAELIRYSDRDALFSLGPLILTLSSVARAGMPIIGHAAPVVRQLAQDFHETVVLSIWDGGTAVVVYEAEDSDSLVQVSVRTGSRLELEDSAQGRLFCAYLDPEVEPMVAEALEYSPELRERVATIRAQGYAANFLENNGVRSVAVPVIAGSGEILASIAIVGTSVSVPERPESGLVSRMVDAASEISGRTAKASSDENLNVGVNNSDDNSGGAATVA